jgi:type III restriction enzyme
MAVENPRAFLAGRLIDTVEELDAPNDKEAVLALVDSYLAQIDKPAEELGKLAHLYRDAIVNDLKAQVEAHIQDNTKVDVSVSKGFITFRGYDKTVLEKDGIVGYQTTVPPRDIRHYLFEGFKKSFFPQVPFDSTPEKDFAAILERDKAVMKWIRPSEGDVHINYRGRSYNPDFIVETADRKYLTEIKARNELEGKEVREKAAAAIRWCEAASNIKGAKPWEYKLIPADAVDPTRDLKFVLSQAAKLSK